MLKKYMMTFLYALSVLWLLTGCNENKKEKDPVVEAMPITVKVHTLKRETYPVWGQFTGKTQAVDEVMVISRVVGELIKRHFKPGDTVKKGQLLFTIDKREYQAAWDQQNAILQKDIASLNLAKANVRRYTPLVKERLAPREKLDELTATLKQLEATITADKAALKAAKLNLEYCDVKASIDGQIGKEKVLTGNTVNAGTELAKIVQTDFLYVNFNPSAGEVAIIQHFKAEEKPKVKVYLKHSRNTTVELTGHIDFVDNVSTSSTGTVAMRAIVANHKKVIFPGSFVEISILISDNIPVVAVHPDQIFQDQQGQFIYVLNKENVVGKKLIQVVFSNQDMIVLPKEFEGERVVAESIRSMHEGMKVNPVEVNNTVSISQ